MASHPSSNNMNMSSIKFHHVTPKISKYTVCREEDNKYTCNMHIHHIHIYVYITHISIYIRIDNYIDAWMPFCQGYAYPESWQSSQLPVTKVLEKSRRKNLFEGFKDSRERVNFNRFSTPLTLCFILCTVRSCTIYIP